MRDRDLDGHTLAQRARRTARGLTADVMAVGAFALVLFFIWWFS